MTRKPKAVPELAKHHAEQLPNLADPKTRAKLARRWGPNLIDNAKRKMRELLQAAGLPTETGIVTPTDRGAVRGLDELAKRRGHEVGTEVWYAAKIVEEIAYLRRARAGGNADAILDAALHLGALMREAVIVVDNPGAFDLGLKQGAALEKARPAAASLKRDQAAPERQRWGDAAQNFWAKNPRLKIMECARLVIGELGLAEKRERAVRRAIADYRPQK
jgi:hypothetical protein